MRYFIGFLALAALIVAAITVPRWYTEYEAGRAAFAIAEQRVADAAGRKRYGLDFSDLAALDELPSAITEMKDLMRINLKGTRVTDLSPLTGLPMLERVNLRETRVTDISPLATLPSLDDIDVGKSWVFDLEPLVSGGKMERLDIGDTAIRSLEPVTRMRKLNWLNLYNSYAHDGSRAHYDTLKNRGVEVYNGNPYKQNYKPDWIYRLKVRYWRLKEKWGWE